jgi:hypothetical protein
MVNDDAPQPPASAPGQRQEDAPEGIQNKLRVCRAAPFCWQHKAARRKIRDAFDRDKTVHSALGTYDALTEIASDEESEIFETTHAWIALLSGFSQRTVGKRLPELEEIGLIEIDTPALKAPSTIRLLAVGVKQPLPNAPQRTKRAPLPTSEQKQKKELNKGEETPRRLETKDGGLLVKDRERIQNQIQHEKDRCSPDREVIAGMRSELAAINDELRRRGKQSQPVTATDDAPPRPNDRNAGTFNAERAGLPISKKFR